MKHVFLSGLPISLALVVVIEKLIRQNEAIVLP